MWVQRDQDQGDPSDICGAAHTSKGPGVGAIVGCGGEIGVGEMGKTDKPRGKEKKMPATLSDSHLK